MDDRLNFAPLGYFTIDDDSRLVEMNRTLLDAIGYTHEELQGQHLNSILSSSSRLFYQLYVFPMIRLQEKVEAIYMTLQSKSGQEIPILLNALRNERSGTFYNDCACFPMKERFEYESALLTVKKSTDKRNELKKKQIKELDILRLELEAKQNELLEMNEKLKILSETDGLTGLRNRRSLQESLTAFFNAHEDTHEAFSFLLIDIDHFKEINDTFGHMTGDWVLREFGRMLERQTRKEDMVARYGGEEFSLLLPNTDKTEALRIAESIRQLIETADWGKCTVTISIGIATIVSGDTESSLQSKADSALYVSKDQGRNRVTHASDVLELCL